MCFLGGGGGGKTLKFRGGLISYAYVTLSAGLPSCSKQRLKRRTSHLCPQLSRFSLFDSLVNSAINGTLLCDSFHLNGITLLVLKRI